MYGLPSASSALFNCALECALRRRNRRCQKKFGAYECMQCKYYINKYIDADPRHVELFMREAEFRAGAIKATSGGHRFVYAFLTALFLFFAWIMYKNEQRMNEAFYYESNASKTAAYSTTTKTISPASEHANIERTLRIVAEKWKRTDVNGDGLYNCIDAAVLFYKYYPDKSKVCIETNENPKTGMNHLFNCVFTDGVWKAIEPQAYYSNRSNYYMWSVWGNQYDNKYNRDVTDSYKKYAR